MADASFYRLGRSIRLPGPSPEGGIEPPAHLESCIARRPSQRAGADKRSDMNHRVHLYEAKLMDG